MAKGLWDIEIGTPVVVFSRCHNGSINGRIEQKDGLHVYVRVGCSGTYKFYIVTGSGVGSEQERRLFLGQENDYRDIALARVNGAPMARPRRKPRKSASKKPSVSQLDLFQEPWGSHV